MDGDERRNEMDEVAKALWEVKKEIALTNERLEANTKTTKALVDVIQGTNGDGLRTTVKVIGKSVQWLTWGMRIIVGGIVVGFIWLARNFN